MMKPWKRYLALALGAISITGLLGLMFFSPLAKDALDKWLQSEGFQNMLSHQVSKAIKVDGEFGTLKIDGWQATTPEYRSTGWPGEAIGSINADGIVGKFNPWAVLRRVWEVERIDIERGSFALRLPQDELKRQIIKGKKPWYAWLMPDRFYCGWIECKRAEVIFPFQGQKGKLKDVHLGATMIGRDFKYFIYDGVLEFPLLPDLKVQELKMLITREKMEIDYADLVGMNGDRAWAQIHARVGMREDKSTQAKVVLHSMPFTRTLPEVLKERLTGRVTGKLNWNTDKTGKNITSDGIIELEETVLQDWTLLNEMARLHNNPELKKFSVESGKIVFEIKDHQFKAKDLDLQIWNKVRIRGTADYNWVAGQAEVDFKFDQVPIEAWLPQPLKARFDAGMNGTLKWRGQIEDWKDSQAVGTLNADGARVRSPFSSIQAFKKAGVRFPDAVLLNKAQLDFDYKDRTFRATRINIDAADAGSFTGTAQWSLDNEFNTDSEFKVKNIHYWIPLKWAKHVQGDVQGVIKWSAKEWKWETSRGDGILRIKQGKLLGLDFQKALARFFKKDIFNTLSFERSQMEWKMSERGLALNGIDFLVPKLMGVRGNIFLTKEKKLSGKLKVGLAETDLLWLPEAKTAVFKESHEGLHWASVTIGGTLSKPKQDLSQQIMKVLSRHPLTLLSLGFRGLSWWLGDFLGTYE